MADLKDEEDNNSKCESNLQNYKNQIQRVCPVWAEWTDCSKSCEGGTQTRINKCSNESESRTCNQEPCRTSGNH